MHWCLAVSDHIVSELLISMLPILLPQAVDFNAKQISYYDSFKGHNPECLLAIKSVINTPEVCHIVPHCVDST